MAKTYLEQVKEDVKTWLSENEDRFSIEEALVSDDVDEIREELENILWTEDSVTGNASGSYTFNREEAKQHVLEDMDTVIEALRDLVCDLADIGLKFLEEDWEYFDVTARCYVLNQAISEVLEESEVFA